MYKCSKYKPVLKNNEILNYIHLNFVVIHIKKNIIVYEKIAHNFKFNQMK